MFEYNKVKSSAKHITTRGPELRKLILETMGMISKIVGDTLGPGGRQVMLERFEHGIPPQLTKDGVTAFRSIGLQHPAAQCIVETARDASIRTASEAGDGTTTATILSEAIVRRTFEFCDENPHVSPQKVVRYLEAQFRDVLAPAIDALSIKVDSTTEEGQKLLRTVAKVSANGDEALADAVMECFGQVGDAGNITILESAGPSSYEVEKIVGFPVPVGFEESCAKFYPMVINDPGGQRCYLENPVFVLYNGMVSDANSALKLLCKVGDMYELFLQEKQKDYPHCNVVFFANSFSENALASFCASFRTPGSIRVLPVVVPKTAFASSQTEFLKDMAAITGATVFEPIVKPLDSGELHDLGPGVDGFESSRWRSAVVGRASERGVEYEDANAERLAEVEAQLEAAISDADRYHIKERLGKLSGGIAKLKVIGASNGELKEKRDRADDAVCAVRGAIKYGCLPGGGWTLLKLASMLPDTPVNNTILKPALMEPVFRLLFNLGFNELEARGLIDPVLLGIAQGRTLVYNAESGQHGDAVEIGVLDSTPAVREAVRNSISIASLLGTLGGIIAFERDAQLERSEARDTQDFIRNANINEANERA